MDIKELETYFDLSSSKEIFEPEKIDIFIKDFSHLLMFDYLNLTYDKDKLNSLYNTVQIELNDLIKDKKDMFLAHIFELRRTLNTSIEEIFKGDPASASKQEIVLVYPGFKAILFYRIAHVFYLLDFKLIARYISERAHHQTGIDINPGATIGDYFFIDHGTGIVIGETCIIGNHVKLYQGVTLGALSLSKGRVLEGTKRHPTVEDNVTIYANAAIFGGNTIIGENSTIGGDVYLTHSVEANSIVLQTDKNLTILKK